MRVISLVPSLTETLIECGINVVGRTQFCIHPADRIAHIPSVGGTKAVNWRRCAVLKPDLVVFDREENTLAMKDACPYDWIATHITSVGSVGNELEKLAQRIGNATLSGQAKAWSRLASSAPAPFQGWDNTPGLIAPLSALSVESAPAKLEYIIWRKPWTGIGPDTFIHSMLRACGFGEYLPDHAKPYPELSADIMAQPDTFYLFSSEPYDFLKEKDWLEAQGFRGAIVDGEFYSWFGARSFRHLSQLLGNID